MRVLDGIWYGYYLDESIGDPSARAAHFPLKVTFESKGNRISGEMLDEKPITGQPLRTVYEAQRHRLNPKQRDAFEKLLHKDPKARVVATLPSTSKVAGHASGRQVFFLKHYQGVHKVEYVILGESRVVYENSRHRIEYRGELDANSDAIEGQWIIRKRGFFGRWKSPESMGRFRLDRR